MTLIADNLRRVKTLIQAAAERSGRDPSSVQLVAVSKLMSVASMLEVYYAGQYVSGECVFGENYVLEGLAKQRELSALPLSFHLIGAIQSNKIKEVVGAFELVHSVHRLDIAEKFSKQAQKLGIQQAVLLQVNTGGEDSKSGFSLTDLRATFAKLIELPGIHVRGLMTIGRYIDPQESRTERIEEFVMLRDLRDELSQQYTVSLPELSMGMSHDFELAIEEGASLVRVGSSIFGERPGK